MKQMKEMKTWTSLKIMIWKKILNIINLSLNLSINLNLSLNPNLNLNLNLNLK